MVSIVWSPTLTITKVLQAIIPIHKNLIIYKSCMPTSLVVIKTLGEMEIFTCSMETTKMGRFGFFEESRTQQRQRLWSDFN